MLSTYETQYVTARYSSSQCPTFNSILKPNECVGNGNIIEYGRYYLITMEAFGEDFTNKLVKDINTGAINAKEGLKILIKELDNTKITAQQKQAVISDIFAAIGEDLGSEFMPVMKAITQETGQLDKAFNNLSSGQKANLESE